MPTTLQGVLMVEMVNVPVRMPTQGGVATPSLGGKEGIIGTGVSHQPEANQQIASFLYYSYRRKYRRARGKSPTNVKNTRKKLL